MSENGTVEKKATTEAERAKYIKAAILAAAGGAGIGAIIRSRKANKVRAKEGNPETARNTIIVPIKKTKFLEELPTPRELAESRGEQPGQASNGDAGKPADAAAEAEAGSAGTSGSEALTPEQIAAKKKEIIGNGRKFNFFGKRAAAKTAQAGEAKKEDPKSDDEKDKGEKGEKKEDEGRTLFRDQEGKFVSPTDPVAVAQSEKDAFSIENLLAPVIHPIDTLGSNAGAIFDKPVLGTVGALGSIYLAAKISDAINERRRSKAKERLEQARAEYIGILEGDEKKAEAGIDLRTTPGAVLGTAFFVPMAAAALVTSKIIENRKIEKKKQKEMSDSYPDDPVILYKTSEAKEIPMTPEALIAVLAVKRAMFISAEKEARDEGFGKEAGVGNFFASIIDSGRNALSKAVSPMSAEEATNVVTGMMANPDNNLHLLSLTRGWMGNDQKMQEEALANMAKGLSPSDQIRLLATYNNAGLRKKVMDSVRSSQRVQDTLVDRFTNSAYDESFGKFREELVNKEIGKTFKQDGLLYKVISWIANNMGLGKYMAGKRINDMFAATRSAQQQAAKPAAPAAKPSAPAAKPSAPAAKPAAPTAAAPAQVAAKPVQAAKPAAPAKKVVLQTPAAKIVAPFGNLAPWMPKVK